jgi:sulfite exporter TauE/SafE
MSRIKPGPSKDWVVLTLAFGFSTALNIVVFAVLWDALFSKDPGLSENAVQLLTGWGGGVIGVIGAYVGYKAGATHGMEMQEDDGTDTGTSSDG